MSDPRCPLCGSPQTQFRDIYDGFPLPPHAQRCSSNACGLPANLWEQIVTIMDENASLRGSLGTTVAMGEDVRDQTKPQSQGDRDYDYYD